MRSPHSAALPSDGMGRHADFSLTASPGKPLAVAARASGARIVDEDGRSYLDACGGAMVMSLGHCHPRLVEVVQRQVAELSFTYRFSFRNGPMLELAEELRSVSPLESTWCFFNSSGSESVESAIQLARRYWQLRGRPAKTDLISRWPSFHGSTHGALSLSGSKWRAFYESVLDKHPVAPVPNADIRRRRPPAEEAAWAARELEDALLRRGAGNVAAVVIEPVTGASGAAIAPPPGYMAELRRVLRPPRRTARVRRDDHGLRAHGGVVRRLPLARRDARHHHVREGRDERHRAVLGRARERRDRRGVRAVGRRLPLRSHVLGLPARLRGRDRGHPRDPRRGSGGRVAAQGRAAARAPGRRWPRARRASATCAGSDCCRASSSWRTARRSRRRRVPRRDSWPPAASAG